jgi:hypothetical protein
MQQTLKPACTRRRRAPIVSVICLAAVAIDVVAAQRSAARDETTTLTLPTRRAPDMPPAGPPALPPAVDRVRPLTLAAVTRRAPATGRPHTLRQTITRTATRIHVAKDDGREWLFERNTVDPQRVTGFLVEHGSRAIVIYEESDLRIGLGIGGWADVLSFGFDPGVLKRLRPTEETRDIGGIPFMHYTLRGHRDSDQDVWWSEEQGFASSVTIRDAATVTTFSIERIIRDVDPSLLRSPSSRFPTYRVVDLAAWLEHR